MKKVILSGFIILCLCFNAFSDESKFIKKTNSGTISINPKKYNREPLSFTSNTFLNSIVCYQYVQKALNKYACRFYPSCSRYTYLSIERFGYFKGLSKGIDRISRCNGSASLCDYPMIGNYFFDPIDLNYEYNGIYSTLYSWKEEKKSIYLDWLIENEEYDIAYTYQLKKYFQDQSLHNRIILAKISLLKNDYKKVKKLLNNEIDSESIFLKAYCEFKEFNYDKSILILNNIYNKENNSRLLLLANYIGNDNLKNIDNLLFNNSSNIDEDLYNKIQSLKNSYKISPYYFAFSSSVVPGSGQILAGFIVDGLVSFISNTYFGYDFYKNIEDGNVESSIISGSLFALFYTGNIVGGYYSKRRNIEFQKLTILKRINNLIIIKR